MAIHTVSREIAGKTLTLETGKMAKQADGALTVQYGETVVFCAAVSSKPREGIDFFPLTVDYREMTYAAGKFPGGYFKREGRPTHKETLTARSIDRPIRPLFPETYKKEVSVSTLVLSADPENDPDILAMNAASAALMISTIPFHGPIGTVRVGRKDGRFIVNPTYSEVAEGELDMILSGDEEKLVMIEVEASEIPEAVMLEAIEFGHEAIKQIVALQKELIELAGKPKQEIPADPIDPEVEKTIREKWYAELKKRSTDSRKLERKEALKELKEQALEALTAGADEEKQAELKKQLSLVWEKLTAQAVRELVLETGKRIDGRDLKQLRAISCETGLLPRVHGSALFARGETQALTTATLGSVGDEQKIDSLTVEFYKKFMLHYNFPSYSVGETWPNRGPKRREIGHGDLAERSIAAVLPPSDRFPYTIRLVSDIMESNGSTSMATVCGGTMALMDAGVPIARPVAGISVGLVQEGGKNCLLTDIQGEEDHYGDMDFKVAGTQNGVTGVQVDMKVLGLTIDIVRQAFEQAREARMEILKIMLSALPKPKSDLSPHAPRMTQLKINPDKIGLLIGPGGRNIRDIQTTTGAQIDIEDDGTVTIFTRSADALEAALSRVEGSTAEATVGKTYKGRVTSVKDFGAFVEILPGQEGLVHISEISDRYVDDIHEVVKVGDEFDVKVIAVDDQGRVKLSRKALLVGAEAKK